MKTIGRKGINYAFFFTIFFIVFFLYLTAQIDSLNAMIGSIGSTPLAILDAQSNSNDLLFFIEQASKNSIYNSINDIAQQGGFYGDSECGRYQNYNLIAYYEKEINKECYPIPEFEVKKKIAEDLNIYTDLLRKALKEVYCKGSFLGIEAINMPLDNYNIMLQSSNGKTDITGTPVMPVVLDICSNVPKKGLFSFPIYGKVEIPKTIAPIGKFYIKLPFSHSIDYSFNDYDWIKKKASKIIESCRAKQDFADDEELTQCINSNMGDFQGLSWKRMGKNPPIKGPEDRNFAFEVGSNKKLPMQSNNILYKFAVSIPDNAAPPKIEEIAASKNEYENKAALEWKENKALDVEKYEILSIHSKEDIDCGNMAAYYENPPLYIAKSDPIAIDNAGIKKDPLSQKITFEISTEQNQNYCFMVLAIDEIGNSLDKKTAESAKLSI